MILIDSISFEKHQVRSIISDLGRLDLIRGSIKPDRPYLTSAGSTLFGEHQARPAISDLGRLDPIWRSTRPNRPYLTSAGSISFEKAQTRPHSGEHQAQPAIPNLGRLDPIWGSIKPGRPYLTSAGSTSFGRALSSADHTWSRSARSHSRKHQVWPIIPNLDRLDLIQKSIKLDQLYLIST
jgi:hypothetical protein